MFQIVPRLDEGSQSKKEQFDEESGRYPVPNGGWLLTSGVSASHAVDWSIAIVSIVANAVVIGLRRISLVTLPSTIS